MKKLISSIALLAVASVAAMAQTSSATAYQSASASIVSTISLSNYQDLNFGSISNTSSTYANVTSNTSGASTDYATLLGGNQYGMMYVTGTTGANYYVSMPSYTYIYNANGNSMYVYNFTTQSAYTGSTTGHANLMYGYDYIYTGATLQVAPSQAPGTYTGSYAVTVSYE